MAYECSLMKDNSIGNIIFIKAVESATAKSAKTQAFSLSVNCTKLVTDHLFFEHKQKNNNHSNKTR